MRIPFDRLRPQKTGWGKRGLDEKGAKNRERTFA